MANATGSSTEVDQLIAQYEQTRVQDASRTPDEATPPATAALPPTRQKNVEEVLAEMKRVPLFMTSMDDMDEDNPQLEALRALAYEGTPAENADNFRTQGNERVGLKDWINAREYYTKALLALKAPRQPEGSKEGLPNIKAVEVDDEAEREKERAIGEACHANRALCNLEMSITAQANRHSTLPLITWLQRTMAPATETAQPLFGSIRGTSRHGTGRQPHVLLLTR